MADIILKTIKTPCIGVCSTGIGDTVCRGCKRFAHEVIHWNSYSQEQKQLIDERLGFFLAQIVASKLTVVDADKLAFRLRQQQITFSSQKSPFIWAYELLRAGASQIDDVNDYGLHLNAEFQAQPLVELRRIIDHEFYILSEAHYQRYFNLAGSVGNMVTE